MMIEANPDLSTAEMKEILKLTAERRGEPSAPDVDPFGTVISAGAWWTPMRRYRCPSTCETTD